jgi:hypothetical protein
MTFGKKYVMHIRNINNPIPIHNNILIDGCDDPEGHSDA